MPWVYSGDVRRGIGDATRKHLVQVHRRESADTGDADERRAERGVEVLRLRSEGGASTRVRRKGDLIVPEIGWLEPHLDAIRERQHGDADFGNFTARPNLARRGTLRRAARVRPCRRARPQPALQRLHRWLSAGGLQSPQEYPLSTGETASTTRLSSLRASLNTAAASAVVMVAMNRRARSSSATIPGAGSSARMADELGCESASLLLVPFVVRALYEATSPSSPGRARPLRNLLSHASELQADGLEPLFDCAVVHARRHVSTSRRRVRASSSPTEARQERRVGPTRDFA